jgi:hypothetical protein
MQNDTWRAERRKAIVWPGLLLLAAAGSPLPDKPSGLTCRSSAGAVVRLNIDLATRRFQKEGFAPSIIQDISGRVLILTRASSKDMVVEAALDRSTLVYTARSEDLVSGTSLQMRYQCIASAPFAVASGGIP